MKISLSITVIQCNFRNSMHNVITLIIIYISLLELPKRFIKKREFSPGPGEFSSFCMPSSSIYGGAQMRGKSHRTLLRLALIGTNYSEYVSRDRTNSRSPWFKRNFALTAVSLTPIPRSTLRTKLNRSSESSYLDSRHSRWKILLFHYIELLRIIYSVSIRTRTFDTHWIISFCLRFVKAEIYRYAQYHKEIREKSLW